MRPHLEASLVPELLTAAAQTLLVEAPDELAAHVAPGELGVAAGLEVVTRGRLSCGGLRRLHADGAAHQADGAGAAGAAVLTGGGRAGGRCGQLDGIIDAEVLQLNQLTLGLGPGL